MGLTVFLIYPHQLFKSGLTLLTTYDQIWLIEDELFFNQYAFHQKKLMLHRASMRCYRQQLENAGIKTHYAEAIGYLAKTHHLIQHLQNNGASKITLYDPEDYLLNRRLKRYSKQYQLELQLLESPLFLTPLAEADALLGKRFFMANFYQQQRKRLKVLVDADDQPLGGQWSFDADNRKKLPENHQPPAPLVFETDEFRREAENYVKQHFGNNPGDTKGFEYPINSEEAQKAFNDFLQNRLHLFGDYEDALAPHSTFVYHSILTPYLNIGLITPHEIVHQTLAFAAQQHVPLNSLEGFIRQIIGWREFMRLVYRKLGVKQRLANVYGFSKEIPASFYNASTGIQPLDAVISKTLQHAYAHHIERLMVLGNYFFLAEYHPDAVYRWFMELFIDAYDWVMVPNVYGMSLHADGGLITTKPYMSGSNYLIKMGAKKGPWTQHWDNLYWRHLLVHGHRYKNNIRMAMMLKLAEKLPDERKKAILEE